MSWKEFQMRFAKFSVGDGKEVLIAKGAVSHILDGGLGSNVHLTSGAVVGVEAKPEEVAAKLEQL
jgi:hypothetical protein